MPFAGLARVARDAFQVDGVEYYGDIGYLKAGLQFADRLTTVSPTYAAEICTPAGGMGMDGLLRARADVLSGILNGIDTDVWDPARDTTLAASFDVDRLALRVANKRRCSRGSGSDRRRGAAVRRGQPADRQKGIDLVLAAAGLLAGGGATGLLGSGDLVRSAASPRRRGASAARRRYWL